MGLHHKGDGDAKNAPCSILTGGPNEEKNSMNQWPEQGQSNLGKKEKQQKILCPAKPS